MKHRQILALAVMFIALTACAPQSTVNTAEEANKALIRRIHAELTKGNVAIMDTVLAPGYIRHCQAMPPGLQELTDIEMFKNFLTEFVAACPGYADSIGPIIADGDMVAYVSTMHGTQTGPMGGFPPSGKEFEAVNLVMHRFNDEGKVAETWVTWDNVAMLTQLGYFPPPAPPESGN